ncbi:MAG: ATP-binding cassette domain-containing protein [Parachlamydiales bacterium]|jgi:ABC-2 type transport system ATP-binding protein
MPLITVEQLQKTFRITKRKTGFWGALTSLVNREHITKTALDGISFHVDEGELVGYIGPNGAGKSTTVKILSGILVPDQGQVELFGKTPWKSRLDVVSKIGVVFGQRTQLWWDLPVVESFQLLKDIYSIPDSAYNKSLDELVAVLEISRLLDVPVRQLSLGQRMRCDIAAALLHNPKILFLDEPTIGLDAVSKLAVRDFVRHLNKTRDLTVLLTTHDMDDIETLCSRVIILNEGKIFSDGTLGDLRKLMQPERYLIIDLIDPSCTVHDHAAKITRREGPRVWLSFNPEEVSTPELISRVTSQYAVSDLFVENPSIEEIIARLYREANL